MNEFFTERFRAQRGDISRPDDPRYSKNADALYVPPSAFEVLSALVTYPGIDGPMFDNALVSFDAATGQVAIEVDDLTHATYVFGSAG